MSHQPCTDLCATAELTPAGIVLFQLFHSLVQQLPAGGGSEGVPSPLSVLPLMASQIAQVGVPEPLNLIEFIGQQAIRSPWDGNPLIELLRPPGCLPSCLPCLTWLQLAAGGVVVGLAAGMLTRRLLRALRWHGASACQVCPRLCLLVGLLLQCSRCTGQEKR